MMSTEGRVCRWLSRIFFVAGFLFAYIGPWQVGMTDLIAAILFQLYVLEEKMK